MTTAELLTDAFGRIRETVENALDAMSPEQLAQAIEPGANPVGWLIWHLTRIQDDHIAGAFGVKQVWETGGWATRLGLPEDNMDTGYGHSPTHVSAISKAVSTAPGRLLEYRDAVYQQTLNHVADLADADLSRAIDNSWTPPVTLGVRLVSVINDDMQHAGQALYARGILLRR
jgi:hypothetical protein